MKSTKSTQKAVLVTTDSTRRGVFFGYLESFDRTTQIAVLTQARLCVYWSRETHGVFGLAAKGPAAGSKIGPAVPRIELNGVTAVCECSDEAVAAMEKEPWA